MQFRLKASAKSRNISIVDELYVLDIKQIAKYNKIVIQDSGCLM